MSSAQPPPPPPLKKAKIASGHSSVVPGFLDSLLVPSTTRDQTVFHLAGKIWNARHEGNLLVVRQCYKYLLKFVVRSLTPERGECPILHRFVCVTGSAGIGKTYFGLYVSHKLYHDGLIVRLWYGDLHWVFAKNLDENDPLRQLLSHEPLSDGSLVWYYSGDGTKGGVRLLELLLARDTFPPVYTVRDSGQEDMIGIAQGPGSFLYTISDGQTKLLKSLTMKVPVSSSLYRRYAPGWNIAELLSDAVMHKNLQHLDSLRAQWEADLKDMEEIVEQDQKDMDATQGDTPQRVQPVVAPPLEFNTIQYLARLAIKEGYRRYGGSARSVLRFMEYAYEMIWDKSFLSADEAANFILKIADEQMLIDAVDHVANLQDCNQQLQAKSKAIVFASVPAADLKSVTKSIATQHIAKMLASKTRANSKLQVNRLVAALGSSGMQQSAFGVLYEESMHRQLLERPTELRLRYLGHHEKHVSTNYRQKEDVTLRLPASLRVKVALGFSLSAVEWADNDLCDSTYVQPFGPNFPCHDAFVFVKASMFYELNPALDKKQSVLLQRHLDESFVLVGLQMTVSGSGHYADKPSHTLRSVHLSNHLTSIKTHFPDIFLDVVTIFVSPTKSVRKMRKMPVLKATGDSPTTSSASGLTEGLALQYSAVQEDDYVAKLVGDDLS